MLLIFDVDETLCDSAETYKARGLSVIRKIGEKNDVDFSEAKQAFDLLVKIHKKDNKGNVGTRAAIKLGLTREEFLEALSKPDPAVFVSENKELASALSKLAKKHTLVAFSNAPQVAAAKVLKTLGIDQYFSKIYGANNFEKSKPNPDAFKQIAQEFGFDYDQIISIGDSIAKEIIPAKSIGGKAILLNVNNYEATELADAIINKIDDVVEAVDTLTGASASHRNFF